MVRNRSGANLSKLVVSRVEAVKYVKTARGAMCPLEHRYLLSDGTTVRFDCVDACNWSRLGAFVCHRRMLRTPCRWKFGALPIDIVGVVSNHIDYPTRGSSNKTARVIPCRVAVRPGSDRPPCESQVVARAIHASPSQPLHEREEDDSLSAKPGSFSGKRMWWGPRLLGLGAIVSRRRESSRCSGCRINWKKSGPKACSHVTSRISGDAERACLTQFLPSRFAS